MTNPRTLDKTRAGAQYALMAGFLVLLWLPMIGSLFHWDKPILNEKRALAKMPAWNSTASGVRDFVAGLDAYYGDHFGFRNRLITWQHLWKRRWFKESSESAVMIGREGWLYYSDGDMVDNFRVVRPFLEERLRSWRSLLEARRDWLAARGIQYVFVVPPDKQTIYPEYLPEWMARLNPTTKLDQFISYMRANSSVEVVDLRPALLRAKARNRTYYQTDSHWNQFGALVGCQALMEAIARKFQVRTPIGIGDFNLKIGTGPVGDLTAMMGEGQFKPEADCPLISAQSPRVPLSVLSAPSYAGGKSPQLPDPVMTENSGQNGKALVFRDSFSDAWIPILGYHFHRVVYFWQHSWNFAAINQEKPEIVIDEFVERVIYEQDPKVLGTQEYLK